MFSNLHYFLQTLYKTQVKELREELDEKNVELAELLEAKGNLMEQLQVALQRADSEALARSVAEETVAELEKEKTVKELEINDVLSRHSNDINTKDNIISTVSIFFLIQSEIWV